MFYLIICLVHYPEKAVSNILTHVLLQTRGGVTVVKSPLSGLYHDQGGFIPGTQGWLSVHKSSNRIHHICKMKDENHTPISIDVEIEFDKIQYLFMIKIPR